MKREINFTFLVKKYPGQWVALGNDEKTVFGKGKTAKAALLASKRKGQKMPILYKVPTKVTLSVSFCS